ncbi:MAG: hypothetical protein ABJ015_30860 [Rhodopirellula bahusiensis]
MDHEPLLRAAAAAQCFAVQCIDPRQFETTALGFHRTGPFEIADTPELFTDFRKQIEKHCEARPPLGEPSQINCELPEGLEAGEIPTLNSLGLLSQSKDDRCLNRFPGGQTAGNQRLQEYIWDEDRLRVYKQTRNGMLAPNDSSKFSPWLAHGCISARTIADHVRRYEDERVENKSTYWMIFELLWRDYFRWITRIQSWTSSNRQKKTKRSTIRLVQPAAENQPSNRPTETMSAQINIRNASGSETSPRVLSRERLPNRGWSRTKSRVLAAA